MNIGQIYEGISTIGRNWTIYGGILTICRQGIENYLLSNVRLNPFASSYISQIMARSIQDIENMFGPSLNQKYILFTFTVGTTKWIKSPHYLDFSISSFTANKAVLKLYDVASIKLIRLLNLDNPLILHLIYSYFSSLLTFHECIHEYLFKLF